jgi:hypothetical protein
MFLFLLAMHQLIYIQLILLDWSYNKVKLLPHLHIKEYLMPQNKVNKTTPGQTSGLVYRLKCCWR